MTKISTLVKSSAKGTFGLGDRVSAETEAVCEHES
jgi:hypothetical protein